MLACSFAFGIFSSLYHCALYLLFVWRTHTPNEHLTVFNAFCSDPTARTRGAPNLTSRFVHNRLVATHSYKIRAFSIFHLFLSFAPAMREFDFVFAYVLFIYFDDEFHSVHTTYGWMQCTPLKSTFLFFVGFHYCVHFYLFIFLMDSRGDAIVQHINSMPASTHRRVIFFLQIKVYVFIFLNMWRRMLPCVCVCCVRAYWCVGDSDGDSARLGNLCAVAHRQCKYGFACVDVCVMWVRGDGLCLSSYRTRANVLLSSCCCCYCWKPISVEEGETHTNFQCCANSGKSETETQTHFESIGRR